MLEGIQIYRNQWNDVLAWRWKKGRPGFAEVVRANRRDYRQSPVRWTIRWAEVVDGRKLDLKWNGLKKTSVEALRGDESVPDVEELLAGLEQRFNPKP